MLGQIKIMGSRRCCKNGLGSHVGSGHEKRTSRTCEILNILNYGWNEIGLSLFIRQNNIRGFGGAFG